MFDMIGIKRIVISNPVCELDIDGRITRFHKLQIHKQSASPSIAVDKGMDALKINMESGQHFVTM